MCMAYESRCKCGSKSVSFHFRDSVMSYEIIRDVYCPDCSSVIAIDPDTMVVDNGWVIEYDMEMARFMGQRLRNAVITAGFIFDGGYCTWNGMYPGDHIDSVKEREEIAALAKTDPVLYLKEMKSWATERIKRLREEGWRKAREEEPVKG